MSSINKNKHPWTSTPVTGDHLDIMVPREVPAEPDDYLYTIESQYNYRPDLLAYHLYGTDRLWWVFARRNMNTISDSIFDFVAGTKIYLPKKSRLMEFLG